MILAMIRYILSLFQKRDENGRFIQISDTPARIRPRRQIKCSMCGRFYGNDISARHRRSCKGTLKVSNISKVTDQSVVRSHIMTESQPLKLSESSPSIHDMEPCSSTSFSSFDKSLADLVCNFREYLSTPSYIFSERPNLKTISAKISGLNQIIHLFSFTTIEHIIDADVIYKVPHDPRLMKSMRNSTISVSRSTVANRLQSLSGFLGYCSHQKLFSQSQVLMLKKMEIYIDKAAKEALICKMKDNERSQHRPVEDFLTTTQAKQFYQFLYKQKMLLLSHSSKSSLSAKRKILLATFAVYCNCFNICRPSTVIELKISEFEKRDKSDRYHTIIVDGQKNSRTNFPYLSLPPEIVNCVKEYLHFRPKPKTATSDFMFLTSFGNPYTSGSLLNSLQPYYRAWKKSLPVSERPCANRYVFGACRRDATTRTQLTGNGPQPKALAQVLGHSKDTQERHYTRTMSMQLHRSVVDQLKDL